MRSPNMKRGEIWTVGGRGENKGKPRPAVIIQDDRFAATAFMTLSYFATDPTEALLRRVPIEPSEKNGLRAPSRLMVDKLTTVPEERLGSPVGRLGDEPWFGGIGQSSSSWDWLDRREPRIFVVGSSLQTVSTPTTAYRYSP
jgi:mRNA interferase MazF